MNHNFCASAYHTLRAFAMPPFPSDIRQASGKGVRDVQHWGGEGGRGLVRTSLEDTRGERSSGEGRADVRHCGEWRTSGADFPQFFHFFKFFKFYIYWRRGRRRGRGVSRGSHLLKFGVIFYFVLWLCNFFYILTPSVIRSSSHFCALVL